MANIAKTAALIAGAIGGLCGTSFGMHHGMKNTISYMHKHGNKQRSIPKPILEGSVLMSNMLGYGALGLVLVLLLV